MNKEDSQQATTEDEGGSNDCSRRLVEYFVVVSSVPKTMPMNNIRGKEQGKNNVNDPSRAYFIGTPKSNVKKGNHHQQQQPPSSPSIYPRMAARVDARRAHLEDDWGGGSTASEDEEETANLEDSLSVEVSEKQYTESVVEDCYTQPPPILSPTKSTGGDSVFGEEQSSTSGQQQKEKTTKNKFFRSMSEQKKKLGIHINTSGLKGSLENKLKSMSFSRSGSSSKDEGDGHRNNNADDDSSVSSYSSFSSFEDSPTNKSQLASIVRPSPTPSTVRKQTPAPPPPTSQQTPPPPSAGSYSRGASENIRMDDPYSAATNTSRDFNDDIDDCILEPVITAQYPPVNHPDNPLNPMIPQFCHPHGVEYIQPLHEYKMPTIHHFVLTDAKGGKLYGTCLTVYEEFLPYSSDGIHDLDDMSLPSVRPEDQERGYVECAIGSSPTVKRHRRRSRNHTYYAPRVLCLLSTWPYLSAFRTYLTQLYRLATTTNLMSAPIERYIMNICAEVPAPPPGSFEVQLSILDSNIRFWAPPADQPIPYVSVQYGVLFECLDIGNVLFAWYTLACERKILLVSSQSSLLTVCAEILCSMLFPMKWSHLYIPVLPRFLTPMLDAPMPYLCGISRENFPYAIGDISDETVVVDLDRNLITMGTHTPDLPSLPHRRKMKLEASLEKYAGNVFWKARGLSKAEVEKTTKSGDKNALEQMFGVADAVWDEKICAMDEAFNLAHAPDSMSLLHEDDSDVNKKQSRWDAVQEAFLRFYVSMLKDYRKYLPTTTTEHSSWRGSVGMEDVQFRVEEFVTKSSPDFQPFLEELVGTQQFDDFITRRMYNKGKAPDVSFFDESISAKKNRSKLKLRKVETPFLNSAVARREMKRIDAVTPNSDQLPQTRIVGNATVENVGRYTYPTFPESFDESLFGSPRPIPKIITAEFDRRSSLAAMLKEKRGVLEESRMSGSNNPSAEATAFVLFFVTFSQIIGKDWVSFKEQHGNLLDDDFGLDYNPINGTASSASDVPWAPTVNPPWMAGDSNFQSLHSNFRPQEQTEQVENVVDDAAPMNPCCISNCEDMCTDLGKAVDPSTFIGVPWSTNNALTTFGNDSQGQVNDPIDEKLENEIEKARSVAKAQVDLGYNTLKMMRLRKLPTESITYKSLIEACGRCGIAHRATQLLEMMTQDGLAVDSEVYFCFINAFSHVESGTMVPYRHHPSETASEISASVQSIGVDSSVGGNGRRMSQGEDDKSLGSKLRSHTTKIMDGFHNTMSSTLEDNRRAFKASKSKRLKRLFKQGLTKEKNLTLTSAIRTQNELGDCLLEDLYPGLAIDTSSDACPKCSCVLSQDNIILGWTPCEVKDYSTTCPSCKHRFVPTFSISCNVETFEGSQGKGTPLYCDYLSPWVLLREIRSLITKPSFFMDGKAAKLLGADSNDRDSGKIIGIEGIIDPTFRLGNGINATLWWNMIVTFRRFKLPYTFLLQGSYEDQQLIMPTLDDV